MHKFGKEKQWVKQLLNILQVLIILLRLLVFQVASGSVTIASIATVIGVPVGITNAKS